MQAGFLAIRMREPASHPADTGLSGDENLLQGLEELLKALQQERGIRSLRGQRQLSRKTGHRHVEPLWLRIPAQGLIQFPQTARAQSPGKACTGQPQAVTHCGEPHLQEALDGALRPAQMTHMNTGKNLSQLQNSFYRLYDDRPWPATRQPAP